MPGRKKISTRTSVSKSTSNTQFPMGEDVFRLIAENVDDLIAILDLTGKRLYCSPSYHQVLGRDPADLVGTDSFSEIHPDDRESIRETFRETVRTGVPRRAQYRFFHSDGSVRSVESQASLIHDGQGKLTHIVVVSRDVTAREHSANQLRLLAHALSCTRDCFCLTDLQNHVLFVNKAFTETYGYVEDEIVGQHISIIKSKKEDRDAHEDLTAVTLAGGWAGELMNRRKDGSEFPVELWTSVVHDDHGNPTALVGVARDITERKLAEETMAQETEFWNMLMDSIPDTIYFKDRQCRFMRINKAQAHVLGVDKVEDAIGKSDADFFLNEHADSALHDEHEIMRTGKSIVGKVEPIRTRDGVQRWFSATKFPMRDSSGQIVGIIGSSREITDLKKIELRLVESESKYRLLFDSNPESMFVYDNETLRFLAVNSAAIERYGYAQEEMLRMTITELRPAADVVKIDKLISSSIDETGTFAGFQHQKKDGTIIDVEMVSHPILFDARAAHIIIVNDVTERLRAERLQAAVYRIAQSTETSSSLDELYGAFHTIIQSVMPAENFYIALYEEHAGMLSFPFFVDEVDTPPPPQKLGRGLTEYVLRTGKSLLCDKELDAELQQRGDVELVGVSCPIWLGVPLIVEGKTIGVMTVQHYADPQAYGVREQRMLEFVSSQVAKAIDRKRTESLVQQSEERYRTLFEQSYDAIVLSTPAGKLIDVNNAAVKLFGYPSQESLLGVENAQLLFASPETRAEFKRRLGEHGSIVDFEFEIRRKDGEKRVVLESASVVRDDEGVVIGYRSFLRDVTDGKKLENQLRQAQKMESIGTLAGGIAHDFNNLLGIILGYTSLLEDRDIDPERATQSIGTIKKAVERGAGLVRQLLTFARKSDTQFHSVDVNEVIVELVKMLAQTFPKTIAISTNLHEPMPSVVADSGQLHQALLNLSVNARDAILDADGINGAGRLDFSTHLAVGASLRVKHPEAVAPEYAAIVVKDSGSGMDEETLHRIFEPFFTTKELGKGTGLGLSVVYGVANNHHGFVDVESTPGVGTSFKLYFPLQLRDVLEDEGTGSVVPDDSRGVETLLIVEDEEMLRTLVQGLLEDKGYKVLAAKDGQEGIEMYTEHVDTVSLVLTDMGLPRLGGWEMFMKMKALNPAVKAILASGYCDPNLKSQMVSEGAKDFIQKPYVADVVLRRIREVLDEKD